MPENVQITEQFCSYHVLAKLYSKSFKLGFNSTWTENFQMYKVGFKEAEEPEIKLPRFIGSWRKQDNSRKISTSASLTTLKSLIVGIMKNCGKFFKRWEYQTTLPVSWETCMLVKKQHLEPYMEQLTGSKLGKEYDMPVYCHPVCLTSVQSTSHKMMGWMNHKLESRCQEKYQQPQIYWWYHCNGRRWSGIKNFLMRVKEESEKAHTHTCSFSGSFRL